MPNSLNAYHISSDYANYEAARSGFFSLLIHDIDDRLVTAAFSSMPDGEEKADKIKNAQEGIKLNVVKAPVPHFSIKVEQYRRGNDVVKFAGVPDFKEGSIVVDDVIGIDTKAILMAWQALAYDVKTRKGGRMASYKKNCTLIEYTQDFKQIRNWTLYGCWVSDLTEGDFDKENDGKRQITAKIEYDRAEVSINELASDKMNNAL